MKAIFDEVEAAAHLALNYKKCILIPLTCIRQAAGVSERMVICNSGKGSSQAQAKGIFPGTEPWRRPAEGSKSGIGPHLVFSSQHKSGTRTWSASSASWHNLKLHRSTCRSASVRCSGKQDMARARGAPTKTSCIFVEPSASTVNSRTSGSRPRQPCSGLRTSRITRQAAWTAVAGQKISA